MTDLLAGNMKRCPSCGLVKPKTEFDKASRAIDKLTKHCTVCRNDSTTPVRPRNNKELLMLNNELIQTVKDYQNRNQVLSNLNQNLKDRITRLENQLEDYRLKEQQEITKQLRADLELTRETARDQ